MPPHHPAPRAGANHPLVRRYLQLARGRTDRDDLAVPIEGTWAVQHAFDAGVGVECVFHCPELDRDAHASELVTRARSRGVQCALISARVLGRMSSRDGPSPIAAIVRLPKWRLRDALGIGGRPTRLVVLDGLDSPGNIGAVVRTADATGATGVVLMDCNPRMTHPLVARASLDTVLTSRLVEASEGETLAFLAQHDVSIIAADPAGAESYRDQDYAGDIALVVGNEQRGLSQPVRDAADALVRVPMLGRANSLNVGHAAALLLYEALHRTDVPRAGDVSRSWEAR